VASEGVLTAWKLPFIVAAIAVSIVGGFYLGGPGLGMAVGAMAAAAIVVMAVRHPPRQPIVPPPAADSRRHVLLALGRSLEDGAAVESVARVLGSAQADRTAPDVLLVSPCRNRFLDRWASDVSRGRDRAQRRLVLGVAALAKAGIEARARIGDEDLAQMVEDELRSFPATEVVLLTGSPRRDAPGQRAAQDLGSRLGVPFRHLALDPSDRAVEAAPNSKPQPRARPRGDSASRRRRRRGRAPRAGRVRG
jgi:hypothetical protein